MKCIVFSFLTLLLASVSYADEFALGPSGQERVVASNLLEPDAGWSIASYDASNCLQVSFDATTSWNDDVACNIAGAELWSAKGVWLTALRVVVTTALADSSTGACEFRLTTSDGTSAISGAVLNAGPGSGAAMAVGTVYEVGFNHRLPAGTAFEIEVRNGDQCGAGSSCVCENFGDQQLSVWGRF